MLIDALHSFIQAQGFERSYCLAYSGGLDSQVLLDLCVTLQQEKLFSLRVLHVHHGLSPQADAWVEHCAQSCKAYGIAFKHLAVTAKPAAGESVEEFARKERYALLEKALRPGEILLTAQHLDDQAETILLQLIRGAGLKGLSAMPAIKKFGPGFLGRPLLNRARDHLLAYAESKGLAWVEDAMNLDPAYSRNYLRHHIMPLLKERWPQVATSLARSAEHCAEAQQLLNDFAEVDLQALRGSTTQRLSVKALLTLPAPRQRLALRAWIEEQGVLPPSAVKMQQILTEVLRAAEDANPCVTWGEVALRRFQDELYLLQPLVPQDVSQIWTWDLRFPLSLPGLGKLEAISTLGKGLRSDVGPVEVRFRQGGEVFRQAKGQKHALKKFFQEKGIPPWERDRLPLVYVKEELVVIPGYWVVEEYRAGAEELGYEVFFKGT